MGGLTQAVHIVDGEEGVLVDGIAVIRIPYYEGIDAVEFGYEHFEDAECMHSAERVGGVGAEQNFAQCVPEIWALRNVNCEGGKGVSDAVFRGLREGVTVGGHQGEDAQNGGSVVELGSRNDVDAPLV